MKLKKAAAILMAATLVMGAFAGCGSSSDDSGSGDAATGATGEITVNTREDGSGTRGAFTELFGIIEEVDGEEVDMTTQGAKVTNSTSDMMQTVAEDVNSI